jgi:hypothetical protein
MLLQITSGHWNQWKLRLLSSKMCLWLIVVEPIEAYTGTKSLEFMYWFIHQQVVTSWQLEIFYELLLQKNMDTNGQLLRNDIQREIDILCLSASFDLCNFPEAYWGKFTNFWEGFCVGNSKFYFLRGYNFTNLHPKGGEWVWILNGMAQWTSRIWD